MRAAAAGSGTAVSITALDWSRAPVLQTFSQSRAAMLAAVPEPVGEPSSKECQPFRRIRITTASSFAKPLKARADLLRVTAVRAPGFSDEHAGLPGVRQGGFAKANLSGTGRSLSKTYEC